MGFWVPQHGGGWSWHRGNLTEGSHYWYLTGSWSYESLTNAAQTPHGAPNPNYDPNPAPPDITPPEIDVVWTTAPDIPGNSVYFTDSGGEESSDIPDVRAYKVSPGAIRNAENAILDDINTQEDNYDTLRARVIESRGWNWGLQGHDKEKMLSIMDHMLLAVASNIHSAGVYVAKLNDAAQAYAAADKDSEPPAAT